MTKMKLLFALSLGLGIASQSLAASQSDPNSTLRDAKGKVAIYEGKAGTPGKPGMRLKPGDKVVVRGGSSATIVYDDECREDVGENKVLSISELSSCACRLLTEQKSDAGVPDANSTLRQIKGNVSVNEGREFSPAKPEMRLKPGDRIMAQGGSGATLVFDDSCSLDIEANKLVTVPDQSTCKCGLLLTQGLTPVGGPAIGGEVISNGAGAAIAGGIIAVDLCLTVFCTEDDNNDSVSP